MFHGQFDIRTWYALAGPAAISRPVVDRLNTEVAKALLVPEVRDRLDTIIGGELNATSPQEMRDKVARDLQMWQKIVEQSGVEKQ